MHMDQQKLCHKPIHRTNRSQIPTVFQQPARVSQLLPPRARQVTSFQRSGAKTVVHSWRHCDGPPPHVIFRCIKSFDPGVIIPEADAGADDIFVAPSTPVISILFSSLWILWSGGGYWGGGGKCAWQQVMDCGFLNPTPWRLLLSTVSRPAGLMRGQFSGLLKK